jgi:PAS domain S-box-containing protein
MQGAGGRTATVDFSLKPVLDPAGRVRMILPEGRDITDRKRAEADLKESEAHYQDLVETSQDLIWQCDTGGRYTYLNPAWEEVFGYTLAEMIGKPFSDFQAPDVAARDAAAFARLLDGGSLKSFETVHIGKDGNAIHLVFNAKAVVGSDGQVQGTRGTAYDITERKRGELALRQEQLFSQALLDGLPGIFYLYTYPGLRLVRWNRNHETQLGFGPGELRGRHIMDWHAPEVHEAVRLAVEVVMEKGQNVIESELLTRDGGAIPFLVTGVRFELSGERFLLGVGIDITNLKRAEAEREKLQAQLTQAQKMESVGRLAGGVAHDFNNMLGVILGHTELAMDKLDPSQPLYTHLLEVRKAAERSADLTRQLLAFARKQTIAPKVLDLNDTVESMLKMLRRLIGEDIHLAWMPGANLFPVKVDPSQIDQILANLCVNARDAIKGVGKITIETQDITFDEAYCAVHTDFIPGEYVLLAVSDDGCGMDKETQSHLFEPFFTTKGMGQGTGLGLATVYGIVRQNNGFINVYSEPGHGTRFAIYLPRHAELKVSLTEQAPARETKHGSETILLVEDEPTILRMTEMMLERLGYKVLSADRPGKAMSLAREYSGRIDLLMTDVVMPGMNGRDLAANLLSIYPDIKCLFMSGYTANVIAHHGVLEEGVQFIQKPFSIKDLAAKVRETLDGE